MNDSNSGYDCRKNIDNCTFVLINNELDVSCKLLEQETEKEFNTNLLKLKTDNYYETGKNSLEI